ncbi:acid protease [Imleria badia]|nr:acid protease [Imleria badia]
MSSGRALFRLAPLPYLSLSILTPALSTSSSRALTVIGLAVVTLWNPSSSSTSIDMDQTFTIEYGDGFSVSGVQYTDIVSITGFTATTQVLGAADTYSSGFQSTLFAADGLMGMAFQSVSAFGASPVFQTLVSEGQGFWLVNMDNVQGNGQTIPSNLDAVIDTVSTLHSALGGTAAPSSVGEGFYIFPCGGTSFPISASALNLGTVSDGSSDCVSGVAGQDTSVNTSFDVGNSQVGLATLA